MGRLLTLVVVLVAVGAAFVSFKINEDLEPPTLDDFYWGPSANRGKKEDESVRPFRIAVTDAVLHDFKARLQREVEGGRLQVPLEGTGFEYGFNSDTLRKVGAHWLEKYDWRGREKRLNQFDMFLTKVAGIDVHFLHVKSKKTYKETKPLLLVHGWPGSFVEFYKLIPLLTDPPASEFNFELVIPSIPGYGFSEAPHVTGFGIVETAQVFHKLMGRLGFTKYFVQGGDWGAAVVTEMGALYGSAVRGVHSNMCFSQHPRSNVKMLLAALLPALFLDEDERDGSVGFDFGQLLRESGYMHLQGTKPDTIGAVVAQTPLGMAAYILEKFSGWTRPGWISLKDGGLSNWNLEDLLDNLMIYWVSNTATSSMRYYAENLGHHQKRHGMNRVPVKVPAACLNSKNEAFGIGAPRWAWRDKYHNLLQSSSSSKLGHFAAFEAPEILAEDIFKFISRIP